MYKMNHATVFNDPVRTIRARVELSQEGSSQAPVTLTDDNEIISLAIERLGEEGKFFGFGVMQKLKLKLRDPQGALSITTANRLKVLFNATGDENGIWDKPFPYFYVTEVNRNEKTNELSITAYDCLLRASELQLADVFSTTFINYQEAYDLLGACADLIGADVASDGDHLTDIWKNIDDEQVIMNLDGTELIRDYLNAVAEVTGTIYFVNEYDNIKFIRMSAHAPIKTIEKDSYFNLDSKTNRRLTAICHTTDLGDNIITSNNISGTTQYIRNNPFLTLNENTATVLEGLLTLMNKGYTNGFTINQLDCEWRGHYGLQPGDGISFRQKDDSGIVTVYLINDTIEFDGGLKQRTKWSFADNDVETAANPTNLGTALNETFARVDKLNKTIDLMASEVGANTENIAQIKLNTDNITSSVSQVQQTVVTNTETLQQEIAELRQEVSTAVTKDEYKITISETLTEGVESVSTTTGYTFDKDGLTIEKSGSEMSTMITEDGMTVYRNGDGVLIANNEGVKAEDLHATTYLIIGKYSRFEDYKKGSQKRTGCFWIGG